MLRLIIVEVNIIFKYYLGFVFDQMGRQALKDYTKVIELDPKYARAYCNRGKY